MYPRDHMSHLNFRYPTPPYTRTPLQHFSNKLKELNYLHRIRPTFSSSPATSRRPPAVKISSARTHTHTLAGLRLERDLRVPAARAIYSRRFRTHANERPPPRIGLASLKPPRRLCGIAGTRVSSARRKRVGHALASENCTARNSSKKERERTSPRVI